jgi:16S rRNA (guanine527-N7)-methyltransferase
VEQKQDPGVFEPDKLNLLKIRRILSKNNTFVSDTQADKLLLFVGLLREWNKKLNLISRKDVDNVWQSHILHSLSVVLEVPLSKGVRVLDLGSGGGLPGIPIAIVRPDIHMTMLDATRKKTDAIKDMASRLGLENASVVWGRAEDEPTVSSLRNQFDLVIARAVAPLVKLEKWSQPFVRPHADADDTSPHLIALKGGDLGDEVARVRQQPSVGEVTIKDLTFNGSENIPGVDKKIVTVRFAS